MARRVPTPLVPLPGGSGPSAPDGAAVDPVAHLRSLQLIVVALILGVVTFAGVAAFVGPLRTGDENLARALRVLVLVATALSIVAAGLALLLPARILASVPERETERRVAAFRAGRMAGAALCEGAALFWCVIVLLGGSLAYLGAVAGLVIVLGLLFPTSSQFHDATGLRVREG